MCNAAMLQIEKLQKLSAITGELNKETEVSMDCYTRKNCVHFLYILKLIGIRGCVLAFFLFRYFLSSPSNFESPSVTLYVFS